MLILFYKKKFNHFFSIYDRLEMDTIYDNIPDTVTFIMSDQESLIKRADVIIFDLPFLPKILPDWKKIDKHPDQLWVAWCLESEKNYPWILSQDVISRFDIYMSYHQYADISIPYYNYSFLTELHKTPQQKKKDICMFISSSVNNSKRMDYLTEMFKHIHIDSYGSFHNNIKITNDKGYTSKLEVIKDYKFTIAFENAISHDYVTEKFFDPLLAGSVPIYLGAPNIEEFSPGKNSFINVNDYNSLKELVERIKMLIAIDDLYSTFFEWKNKPISPSLKKKLELQQIHPFVRLLQHIEKKVKYK